MNQKIRSWALALGCLLLVSLYPCLFQYSLNLPESRLADAAVFWGIFAGIGIAKEDRLVMKTLLMHINSPEED